MTTVISPRSRIHFAFLSVVFLAAFSIAVVLSAYWLLLIPFGFLLFYFSWQSPQLLFYLLILSLPWSVEFNFNSSLGTDLPDEPLMWMLTGLFMCIVLFDRFLTSVQRRHPLIMLLTIYYAWIIITIPFSTDWLVSLKFSLAKGWYVVAFVLWPLVIFQSKKQLKVTGVLFLVSILVVAIIIFCRHTAYGLTFASVNKAAAPFFRNHVNYSAMLVCAAPVLVAAWQLNKALRLLIFAGMLFVLTALIFSYSRGAWAALLVGLISYWLISKKRLLVAFTISILLIVASVFWLSRNDHYLRFANDFRATIFHTNFKEHIIATYRLKDISTAERFNRWVAGTRMIKDNLVTGFGPGTFYNNYKPYQVPAFKTWVSNNREHSTVHNYFLLITIEQGLPGLLFFLLLAAAMLFYSETLYHRIADRFYRVAAAACGVLTMSILTVNFLSDLVETDKVGSIFFLCMAALMAIDFNARKLAGS